MIDKRRSAKGGRAVEELGYVNPLTKKHAIQKDRVLYWLGVGAKPSPRIHNLLVSEKIVDAKKIAIFSKTKKAVAAAAAPAAPVASVAQSPAPETGKTEEVKTEAQKEEAVPVEHASPTPEKTA